MKMDVMDDFYKLLHPCMTILVVSVSRDGKPNVMTCAWNMPVSADPPMIAVALGSESYTSQLIKESGEFTVNIPDERLLRALWICGTKSGRSVDKFKLAGLTPRPAKRVKAPIVGECAGIGHFKDITETSSAEWDRVISVNLKGAFLCCKYVIPHMIRAGGGSIVNVSSIVGVRGGERCPTYAASKAGLIGLTKALAIDLMKYNIRVNAVAPRAIETPMMYEYKGDELKERLKRYLFGRLGRPEEVANTILFLASDEATYITGEVIVVGGYL